MSLIDVWNQEPWVRLGATACVALPLAVLIRRLGWVIMRRLARGHRVAADVLHRASAPMQWLVPMLMLRLAIRVRPEAHDLLAVDQVQQVLLIALIIIGAWLIIRSVGAVEVAVMLHYPMGTMDTSPACRNRADAAIAADARAGGAEVTATTSAHAGNR